MGMIIALAFLSAKLLAAFGIGTQSFLVVGLWGSFTTFSAFSKDVFMLSQHGQILNAIGYGSASVIFSIAILDCCSVFCGLSPSLIRNFF